MKALSIALPLALIATAPALAQQDLATPEAKTSYALGLNIGESFRGDGIVIDEQVFLRGLRDALAKTKPALTDEQIETTLGQLQMDIRARRIAKAAAAAEANKTQGEAFLKANGAKPGVVTLPSGLQYQVLTEGKGPKPASSDTVSAHYRGTLIDGTEFDSSAAHGGPASLPVAGVIPGWQEALQLMPVGSKWKLFVPSDLAYGPRGAGEDIGPNAALIFDIELVAIEKE